MKNKSPYLSAFIRVCSIFMVTLLLALSCVQVFHHHVTEDENTSAYEQISTDVEKCSICDFYASQQQSDFIFFQQVQLAVPLPLPVVYGGKVIGGNYKVTLQGFTNKGPPLIS